MKRKGRSKNSNGLLSRIKEVFSKIDKNPKGNNFDLWKKESPQKIKTQDEFMKDIKNCNLYFSYYKV